MIGGIPEIAVTVVIAVALLIEDRFKLFHAVFAGGIQTEQISHHRGLAFIDYKALVLFLVSKDSAVAKYNA